MTNKEFRKILKNENSTLDWMLKNGTLSFGVIYKATEELHKQLKQLEDSKVKNNLGYKVCSLESSMINKLEKSNTRYKCIVKNKDSNLYSEMLSEIGETKTHFIQDLRKNGYIVPANKVKKDEVWNWIMNETDGSPCFWNCFNTMSDVYDYKADKEWLIRKINRMS